MKPQLIAIVAAVVLMGCATTQQSEPPTALGDILSGAFGGEYNMGRPLDEEERRLIEELRAQGVYVPQERKVSPFRYGAGTVSKRNLQDIRDAIKPEQERRMKELMRQRSDAARKAAAAIGLEHKVLLRDLEYYPNLINDLLALEGPHANFNRGSFLGFQKELGKYDLDAFMGGYMSDTLLKLHEANVKARLFLGRHSGTLERFDSTPIQYLRGGNHYIDDQFSSVFKADLLDQIQQRRETILDYWENLRTDGSAWEWSYMWPFTRNKHNTNLTTNIFVHLIIVKKHSILF
mgnify:CR=1 FL=1